MTSVAKEDDLIHVGHQGNDQNQQHRADQQGTLHSAVSEPQAQRYDEQSQREFLPEINAATVRVLAAEDLPWESVHVVQVDERVAPPGHADRNLTHLRESLAQAPLRPDQLHAMPVEAGDLEAAARR